jgi:uncharacterized RDD family membrane protein YckC
MEMEYNEANPYATPRAVVEDMGSTGDLESRKASRWQRLGAWLLDSLIVGVGAAVVMVVVLVIFVISKGTNVLLVMANMFIGENLNTQIALPGIIMLLECVLMLLINGVLWHRNGQSIGKMAVGIKIVRTDGSRAGLSRIFGLRILSISLANFILASVGRFVPSFLPVLVGHNVLIILIRLVSGALFWIDVLMIFGASRRCLHDRIADTIVIRAH